MDRAVISCPSCQAKVRLPADKSGFVICPKCKSRFYANTVTSPQSKAGSSEWQQPVLQILQKYGIQHARPTQSAIGYYLAKGGLTWLLLMGGAMVWTYPAPILDRILIFVLYSVFSAVVGFLVLVPLHRKALQVNAHNAEKELMKSGNRAPILYLRSFQFDEATKRSRWTLFDLIDALITPGQLIQTREQQIVETLRTFGPVIAVGRPGEELPPLGSTRIYVAHDQWKEAVSELAKVSQLVLWATGTTEGLRWELSHLVEKVPPERLLIWAHPHEMGLGTDDREREWSKFLADMGRLFIKPLPATLGANQFFSFDSDGTPFGGKDLRSVLQKTKFVLPRTSHPILASLFVLLALLAIYSYATSYHYWHDLRFVIKDLGSLIIPLYFAVALYAATNRAVIQFTAILGLCLAVLFSVIWGMLWVDPRTAAFDLAKYAALLMLFAASAAVSYRSLKRG